MSRIPKLTLILALLAALVALLVAWFVPLPRLVLSEEEKAGERMPQDRAAVETARADFEKAQSDYKAYVASHDVSKDISTLDAAAHDSAGRMARVGSNFIDPVVAYLDKLEAYAASGERYFSALSHYDDELMAWTRSLGTASEALRPDTWPIVEFLKRYPPPTGEATDYPSLSYADVNALGVSMQQRTTLGAGNPDATPSVIAIAALSDDMQALREAGRSIEYQEGLHPTYYQYLTNYDKKVQAITSNTDTNSLTSGRVTFATGLNLLLGLITLVGLAALFLPRLSKTEASD